MIKRHLIVWKKKEFWPMILTVWHSIMHRKRKLLIKHKIRIRLDKYNVINVCNCPYWTKLLNFSFIQSIFVKNWYIWSKSRSYLFITLPRMMRLCVWIIFVSCVLISLNHVGSSVRDLAYSVWLFKFKEIELNFLVHFILSYFVSSQLKRM